MCTHPYSPGKSISDCGIEDIAFFADRINGLPGKIPGRETPEELFARNPDRVRRRKTPD